MSSSLYNDVDSLTSLGKRDIAAVLNPTLMKKKNEKKEIGTFENVKKIVGVVGVGTGRTEQVQLIGEILEMIERNLKKLFYGESGLIGLDEALETGACGQLLQLSTGFGRAGEVAREGFADQLHFLVKDLSEMRDDRSIGQGLQAVQLVARDGQDLLDVLKQFPVFTRGDQVVFQRARVELHAQFQLTNELLLDADQSESFAFVAAGNQFLNAKTSVERPSNTKIDKTYHVGGRSAL